MFLKNVKIYFQKKQTHTDEITINPPRNELSYKNIFYLSDRGKKILENIFFNDTIIQIMSHFFDENI